MDTLASTWSVSSTFYDNAIAAIGTALINAGAPSNWATTWPDGATSGPWTGIQTSLANLWAQVATQRTALQSSISAAQASAAFAASLAVPTVVSSLPSLPSSSYPSGAYVFNTSTNMMYQSTGSAWVALTVAGSSLVANSVTAAQIAANTITAAQISSGYVYAGNISAYQITTGTLNAANVAVTNLNASNINTGTLSTNMVLFPDGSEVTTASRTISSSVMATGSATAMGGASPAWVSIPGLAWTSTVAATTDTFNIFACINLSSSIVGTVTMQIGVIVDGNTASPVIVQGFTTFSVVNSLFPLSYSFAGLSAGTHTIQLSILMSGPSFSDTMTAASNYTFALCQRVY